MPEVGNLGCFLLYAPGQGGSGSGDARWLAAVITQKRGTYRKWHVPKQPKVSQMTASSLVAWSQWRQHSSSSQLRHEGLAWEGAGPGRWVGALRVLWLCA